MTDGGTNSRGARSFSIILTLVWSIGAQALAASLFDADLSEIERNQLERSSANLSQALGAVQRFESALMMQSFEEGDCEQFLNVESSAQAGDGRSQHMLSDLYRRGYCVPIDDARALQWAKKAAEGGNSEAFFDYGVFLLNGIGGPKSPATAVVWLERATSSRADAHALLARIYLSGEGKPQNYARALDHAVRGAELGDPTSQGIAALLKGDRNSPLYTPSDAYKWALLARASGQERLLEPMGELLSRLSAVLGGARAMAIQSNVSDWSPRQITSETVVANIRLPELTALERGADLTHDDALLQLEELALPRDRAVFFKAIEEDNAEIVRLYLAAGAPIETVSPVYLRTPLLHAAASGSARVVRLLVRAGADVDKHVNHDKDSPVLLALSAGHPAIAKFLIDRGAPLTHPGLMFNAAELDDPELLALLVSKGVPVDNDYVGTPLSHAVAATNDQGKRHCKPRSVAYLLENGADLKYRNSHGESVLEIATSEEDPVPCVELLIRYGASLDNPSGQEALLSAVLAGRPELVKVFLENGADPNATFLLSSDQIPLHLVGESAQALMHGGSLLQLAVAEQQATIAQTLVGFGADSRIKDKRGKSPLSVAKETGQSLMESILLGHY